MASWRMEKKCDNCPFHVKGPGYLLRRSLRPGRWKEILVALRTDHHFPCHKTERRAARAEDARLRGRHRVAGSAGPQLQLQRICERLKAAFAERAAKKEATP